MRQLIINSFEKLIWALIGIVMLGAVIGGLGAMFAPMGPGFLPGLLIIIGGILYAILIGGMLFMVIGIHDNTKRTAEALERMGALGPSSASQP